MYIDRKSFILDLNIKVHHRTYMLQYKHIL